MLFIRILAVSSAVGRWSDELLLVLHEPEDTHIVHVFSVLTLFKTVDGGRTSPSESSSILLLSYFVVFGAVQMRGRWDMSWTKRSDPCRHLLVPGANVIRSRSYLDRNLDTKCILIPGVNGINVYTCLDWDVQIVMIICFSLVRQ